MSATPRCPHAEAFRAAINEKLGFDPGEIIGDGNIHRFSTGKSGKDDAGWYHFRNDEFPSGSFGDWRTGLKGKWLADEPHELLPEEKLRFEQLEAARREEVKATQQRAAEAARQQWAHAEPASPDHPYLKNKGVGVHGLRESGGQLLAALTTDGENIVSLQMIDADGNKRVTPGGRMKGCYSQIGALGDVTDIVIGEGYATCATIHEATGLPVVVAFSAGNLEAVAKSIRVRFPAARIIIAADDDHRTELERGFNPGVQEAKKAAKAVGGTVAVPPFDRSTDGEEPTDWNDFAALRGKCAVAKSFDHERVRAETLSLARLDAIAYERERERAANELGLRISTLDDLVAACREELAVGKAKGLCADVEPWLKPVDVGELLDQVSATISRFIVCDPSTTTAVTLWAAFTWTIPYVHVAPLAVITAPEMRCGKTQLLGLIARLSRRPLLASNISPAAVFRIIEAETPTLLIDEADAFFRANEELRGIVNSGHTRTSAFVIRTVGDNHEPKQFSTWGAKAIAGIGRLADTVMDRAIVLALRRKLPHETVERLRHNTESALFETLKRKLARFGEDYGVAIGRAKPNLPDALNDREQDNWEPLFAIADLAGGHWPERARAAALTISGAGRDNASINEELLTDIRETFNGRGADRVSIADLVETLCEEEMAPWATWNRGRPMTPRQLSRKLAEFGVRASSMRIGGTVQKGYERAQFEDAWSRYLPNGQEQGPASEGGSSADMPASPVTQLQSSKNNELCVTKSVTGENAVGYNAPSVTGPEAVSGSSGVTQASGVTEEIPPVTGSVTHNALKSLDCNRVTDQNPPAGEEGLSPSGPTAGKAKTKTVIEI